MSNSLRCEALIDAQNQTQFHHSWINIHTTAKASCAQGTQGCRAATVRHTFLLVETFSMATGIQVTIGWGPYIRASVIFKTTKPLASDVGSFIITQNQWAFRCSPDIKLIHSVSQILTGKSLTFHFSR